jgi:hypothetical protein
MINHEDKSIDSVKEEVKHCINYMLAFGAAAAACFILAPVFSPLLKGKQTSSFIFS